MKQEIVYGSVLVSPEGRICVVQGRSTGKWSFPKGHPNAGETAFQCAQRETEEETGIRIPWQTRRPILLAVGYYYMILTHEEYTIGEYDAREITQCRWVSLDELRKMRVNVDISAFLKKISTPQPDSPVWGLLLRRCKGHGFWQPSQRCIHSSRMDSQSRPLSIISQET